MTTRLLLLLLTVSLAIAACVASQRCPCGQEFDKDPLDPGADFYLATDHDASEHCYCRCGNGPEQRFPPSRTCEGYEGECERSDGSISQLTCN